MSLLYKFVSIVLLILLSGLVATGFVAYHQLDLSCGKSGQAAGEANDACCARNARLYEHHIKKLVEKFPQTMRICAGDRSCICCHDNSQVYSGGYRLQEIQVQRAFAETDKQGQRGHGYEQQLLKYFRENPEDKDKWKLITDQLGESSWVYARPFIATKDCLECHNTPEEAPKNMLKKYPETTASVGKRVKSKRPRSLLYR